MYRFHHRTTRFVNATPAAVFAELDDHEKLSAHMMHSSAMMAGSAFSLKFDRARGRGLGARIELEGRVLGFALRVEEVVVEYAPPTRKVWATVGDPRLLVIGSYRMGFCVERQEPGTHLAIFIDYNAPAGPWGVLGRLLGPTYARWCSRNMADGVAQHFG